MKHDDHVDLLILIEFSKSFIHIATAKANIASVIELVSGFRKLGSMDVEILPLRF